MNNWLSLKNNNLHKIVRVCLSIVIKLLNVLSSPFNSPDRNDSTTLVTQLINDYLIILLLNVIISKFMSTQRILVQLFNRKYTFQYF